MTPTRITRIAAADAGLNRFFTGLPCKRGHIAERQVSNGGCILCMNPLKSRPGATSRMTQAWQPTLQVPYWFEAAHFDLLQPAMQQYVENVATKWLDDAEAARSAAANPTPG